MSRAEVTEKTPLLALFSLARTDVAIDTVQGISDHA
jgi:hypothetical protein